MKGFLFALMVASAALLSSAEGTLVSMRQTLHNLLDKGGHCGLVFVNQSLIQEQYVGTVANVTFMVGQNGESLTYREVIQSGGCFASTELLAVNYTAGVLAFVYKPTSECTLRDSVTIEQVPKTVYCPGNVSTYFAVASVQVGPSSATSLEAQVVFSLIMMLAFTKI